MKRTPYKQQLYPLHIELLKMQRWVRENNQRILVLFEGRDAAGKGGAIKTLIKHLNPRDYRVVALPKPTEHEGGQWYFQRYVQHLPAAGEIVFFDRSWYNRAGVERVNGFCTEAEVEAFLNAVPDFEAMLTRDGISLVKLWFSITREAQAARIKDRRNNPLKQWKLTPLDRLAEAKWDAYSRARDEMFARTSTPEAPWLRVDANDKRRARIAVIRTLLRRLHGPGADAECLKEDLGLVCQVPDV